MLLNLTHSLCLFHVKAFALQDDVVGEGICHLVLELKEHFEELASKDCEVFLLEKLGVDLRQTIEFGINLVLGDG
jgi:hypothetical protein